VRDQHSCSLLTPTTYAYARRLRSEKALIVLNFSLDP
jgi:hypothetical protein